VVDGCVQAAWRKVYPLSRHCLVELSTCSMWLAVMCSRSVVFWEFRESDSGFRSVRVGRVDFNGCALRSL
jgi:hypothetical protein